MQRHKYLKPGKKSKAWSKVRAQLKTEFLKMGVTHCEMCGTTENLSFAHSKKRRHIVGDEIREVALLCISPCHERLERMPEAEMTKAIKNIIAGRGHSEFIR